MFLTNASFDLGSLRYVTEGSTNYLVLPTVAVVEGVLNDSLVLMKDLETSLDGWEVPIVINHPLNAKGEPISAKSDNVMHFGLFRNATIDNGKMKGESWFDIGKAAKANGDAARVLNQLQSGRMIEVSTAYFADLDQTPGSFGGKPYKFLTKAILPDHLAFLPDHQGACSIQDGCGVPRINHLTQETTMRDIIINILVEQGFTQEALEAMTDEELLAAYQTPPAVEEPVEEQPEPVTNSSDIDPEPASELSAIEQFIANHGEARVLEALETAMNNNITQRANHVAVIVANSEMAEDDLKDLPLATLAKMAKAFEPKTANFAGASPFVQRETSEWEAYEAPQM